MTARDDRIAHYATRHGFAAADVAAWYGLSRRQVGRILHARGIAPSRQRRREAKAERNDAIVALHRIGFSTYELADLFEITQQSAWAVLKRRGLAGRRPTKADTYPTRAAGAKETR